MKTALKSGTAHVPITRLQYNKHIRDNYTCTEMVLKDIPGILEVYDFQTFGKTEWNGLDDDLITHFSSQIREEMDAEIIRSLEGAPNQSCAKGFHLGRLTSFF